MSITLAKTLQRKQKASALACSYYTVSYLMNYLLSWIFGSILGGGTAAIGTIFLPLLLLFVVSGGSGHSDGFSTFVDLTSLSLVGVLVGCLHGGLIGSFQGLLLLNKLPQNEQALHTAYKGSVAGLAVFGVFFNCILLLLTPILSMEGIDILKFVLSLVFLSATVSGLVQGLIQHRIVGRRYHEIFQWCSFSIISSYLGLVLICIGFALYFFYLS